MTKCSEKAFIIEWLLSGPSVIKHEFVSLRSRKRFNKLSQTG